MDRGYGYCVYVYVKVTGEILLGNVAIRIPESTAVTLQAKELSQSSTGNPAPNSSES